MHGRNDAGWLEATKAYIDNRKVFGPDNPELSSLEDHSDQTRLTKLFLELAAKKASDQGLTPESLDAHEILEEAFSTANGITYAFPFVHENDPKETTRRAFRMTWSAIPQNIVEEARSFGKLNVSAPDLEHGVGTYLKSDFTDAKIDRFLVRALADMELSAFLWLQFGSKFVPFDSPLKEASKSVVWSWIKSRLIGLLVTLAVCIGLAVLKAYVPRTPDFIVLGGIALFAGGYLLFTAISFVTLLIYGPKISRERKAALATIKAALDFYNEFHEPGTISLAHYKMRLEEARQTGVVWPQSLWSLIDDMEHRGVRHF